MLYKKNETEKLTTRFFSEKMLMFAKFSLENFTYDFTETFFFPNKKTKEVYEKYMIEQIFPYSVLTDTDSICVLFIFIWKPENSLPDGKFIDVLFEVIKENENKNPTPIRYIRWILGKFLGKRWVSQEKNWLF